MVIKNNDFLNPRSKMSAGVVLEFFTDNDAKEICGKEYTVDGVVKNKPFYETSGGGVTFSDILVKAVYIL